MRKLGFFIFIVLGTIFLGGCAAVVVGSGAALVTKTVVDPRTIGTQVDDNTLVWRVRDALSKNQKIKDYSRINVTVYQGRVLLTGQAAQELAQKAKRIAMNEPGVKDVYNEIREGAKASLSTISNDSWITTKVRSQFIASNLLNSTDIKVITEKGEVFLLGLVTPKTGKIAAEIASRVGGVKRVTTAFTLI